MTTRTKAMYGKTITRLDRLRFSARVSKKKLKASYRGKKLDAMLAAREHFRNKTFLRGDLETFFQAEGLPPGTASGLTTRMVECKIIYPVDQDNKPWRALKDGRKRVIA